MMADLSHHLQAVAIQNTFCLPVWSGPNQDFALTAGVPVKPACAGQS